MVMEARCRKKIAALLSTEQADTFQSLSARSLLDMDTGIDPLGDRVHRDTYGEIPFDTWAAQYNLEGEAKDDALAAIQAWRRTFADLMAKAPEEGGESPAALLARLAQDDPETAQTRFIAYTQRTRLAGQTRTYFVAAESAKQVCLQTLLPIINGNATLAELSEVLDTLDTGHDPFAEMLHKLQRDQANTIGNSEAP